MKTNLQDEPIVTRHQFSSGATVSVIPYPSPVEGVDCLIAISWPKHRNKWGETAVKDARISYIARRGDTAAEWMPPYGPIQIHYRGTDEKEPGCKSATHIFPLIKNSPMSWSQMAVTDHDLLGYLADSNLDPIFRVLADWADR